MSPSFENAVIGCECALALAGAAFIGWLFFSPAGRAARGQPAALPAWRISLTDFLFLGWLVLVIGILGQLLLQAAAAPLLQRQPGRGTFVMLLSGSMFHFGAAATWFLARALARRYRPAAIQPCAPVTPAGVGQTVRGGLLTFLAAMPVVWGVAIIWELFLQAVGLPTERQELVDLFLQSRSPVLLAFLTILALVVAPICEELVFRVGIFGFLRTRTPRWVAFGVSAGLFALLHGNWMGALPLFVLGLTLAVSYERTGRMTVPMVAHALFNLNSLLQVLGGAGK